MRSLISFAVAVQLIFACSDDTKPKGAPLPICSPLMPPGATSFDGLASGVSVGICTEATSNFQYVEASDVVPSGYLALGKAFEFHYGGSTEPAYPHGVDFVIPCDMSKAP